MLLMWTVLFPFPLSAAQDDTVSFDPNLLVSDEQMLDLYSTGKTELALLLTRGSLASYSGPDENGTVRSATDLIWNAAQKFSLSPRFLLVLLQREQSLVEDDRPTQDQLDWAMGFAVCDDCEKSDPRIQKFKGFGNQLYYAAKRIRESYLSDLESRGFTETGVGPGRTIQIDETLVVPANHATAVLYTYTPHLHGNENFVRIWNRWFQNEYVDGSLLRDKLSGDVWLIQHGLRRPITSHAAFLSRFNPNNVVSVGPSLLEEYPLGRAIAFPNYSLLRSPRGTVYLLVDDKRRGFTSQEAFRAHGFSPDEIVDVAWEDLDGYVEGEPITTETVYPQGTLLQDKKTGGVSFIQNGVKHSILSRELLAINFPNAKLMMTTAKELSSYTPGEPLLFPDGTLIGVKGSTDIFVVSQGTRRHIADEATFATFGWKWDQIVWTNERAVLLHSLGEPLETLTQEASITFVANLTERL